MAFRNLGLLYGKLGLTIGFGFIFLCRVNGLLIGFILSTMNKHDVCFVVGFNI